MRKCSIESIVLRLSIAKRRVFAKLNKNSIIDSLKSNYNPNLLNVKWLKKEFLEANKAYVIWKVLQKCVEKNEVSDSKIMECVI